MKRIIMSMALAICLLVMVKPLFGADNPNAPASPVKLIFIHHSTGGQWLSDSNGDQPYGGLGTALKNNNYFVSATNYGWGPNSIGDRTDIVNWPEWFTGSSSTTILNALYTENGQNFGDYGSWTRLPSDPGGQNQIIMFKSCFPNSDLYGNPNDSPASEITDQYTVSNAKAIYNNLLTYFQTRQDKLFVVITAPPQRESEYSPGDQPIAERAANARAFNNWLVNNWLSGYSHQNVAVFDYFNVLTGPDNHHRWYNGAIQHVTIGTNNFAYYPSEDSHPNTTGQCKATEEFVPLLNIFYNRWKNSGTTVVMGNINGSADGKVDLADAIVALKICAHILVDGVVLAADVNNDGKIGLAEAIYALRAAALISSSRLQPSDLEYLGAFRLPGGEDRPKTFAYGGNAMTFNPDGDPSGPSDGFPGSLFVMGHDRIAWDLANGNQVAEISIPAPVKASDPNALNQAGFLQDFQEVAQGKFTNMEEIVRAGMLYLKVSATGPKIHLAWGQHLEPDPPTGTHAWFDPNLSTPNFNGTWFIGTRSFYSVNDYMMEIPASWADAHAQGRYIGTGRFKDGGWGGMGPALFAYRPWTDASGTPAASGTHLQETVLLQYASSQDTMNIERCMENYQHPDEWAGGAWITTPTGKTAVLFAGVKSTGAKYWYGWANPAGPQYPCVEDAVINDFTACRYANGTPCPASDMTECSGHNDYRGWWSSRFDAQFILYDPNDLAKVASGQIASWTPQPYASVDIDQYLFLNPSKVEEGMLGVGDQRRFRIGDVTYDRNHGLVYVLELFADGTKPVVHVWKV